MQLLQSDYKWPTSILKALKKYKNSTNEHYS